jgi:hypothetical protein
VVGLLVAFAYYFVYPKEADQLRKQMEERRELITSEETPAP